MQQEPSLTQDHYEYDYVEDEGNRGCGCFGQFLVLVVLLVALGAAGWGWYYWNAIVQRGPVHVLVLGTDQRPGEQGPFRSDTMLLTRFDPGTPRVAVLAVPRDLWVAIPGWGENRINTAHFLGGPTLAKQTVESAFNLPVHYYVRLEFDDFVGIIDAMGGITVDVPETLHDEFYPTPDYGVTTIHIEAGTQHMDGETALIYARSRHSTSDFDRAQRQQQILAAMKRKLQQPTTWPRLPLVTYRVATSLDTDMATNEWPVLALIALRADNVDRYAIGPDETTPYVTADGAAVLLPQWDRINALLEQMR